MKERPILFSGPMIRAILEGRKTQTRRALAKQPPARFGIPYFMASIWTFHEKAVGDSPMWATHLKCPYGQPGDRLWVKEALRKSGEFPGGHCTSEYVADGADTDADAWPWKLRTLPSMFCPKGLSRITLEVTGVRVERVQEISHHDALAEGVDYDVSKPDGAPLPRYQKLWDSLNAKRGFGWDKNPWVWVVEFRRLS